jgi:hypothetical protein
MSTLSLGADLAWRLAASEAAQAKHEYIEPVHLFITTCKVGNTAEVGPWAEARLPVLQARAVLAEAETLAALFARFTVAPANLAIFSHPPNWTDNRRDCSRKNAGEPG